MKMHPLGEGLRLTNAGTPWGRGCDERHMKRGGTRCVTSVATCVAGVAGVADVADVAQPIRKPIDP